MVLGQLIGALVFDALGLFGVEKRPATVNRVLGVALTVMGVILTNMWTEETIKVVEVPFKIIGPELQKYAMSTKVRMATI